MNSSLFVISRNCFQKTPMRCIMIYKMKKLITAILFLILSSPLCLSASDFHFSIEPRLSVSYGELNELLYGSDENLVSQLDWEQKCLFNLGLSAGFSFHNFSVSALFDYSLPLGTSYMTDSDFYHSGERYSWTEHPIEKSINLNTELALAYEINPYSKVSLIPELQLKYQFSSFEAGNGTGIRNDNPIRVYGIDYRRHSIFFFTGFSLKSQITSRLNLKASFFTAPFIYQNSFDYHHGKKHPFSSNDIQTGCFTKYKLDFSIGIKINDTLSIKLFSDMLMSFPDRGILYTDYYGGEMELLTSQQSGASIRYIKGGTALTINF